MEHKVDTFLGFEGIGLYHQSWRPGQPRAVVVLVHGFGEHSDRYGNVVGALVPRGFAVHAFDLRGHGRSEGARGHIRSWREFREDVRAFLHVVREQEGEGRPLFLFGHSMGGLIVLDYALRYPDALSGVIVSGPLLAQPGVSPFLLWLSRLLSRVWPSFTIDTGLDAGALSRDPEMVRAYEEDPLVHSRASARLGTEITATIAWVMDHAPAWRLPLLVLQGEADRLVPPEGSRRFVSLVTYPDVTYREYPGGYHEPHNDVQREEVLNDLVQWLEAHLEERGQNNAS